MPRLECKVALITGAARGSGRAHAIRFAQEGADIIAVDLGATSSTVRYQTPPAADLAETRRQVEALGRVALTYEADVRDAEAIADLTARALSQLGQIDILVANAGVALMGSDEPDDRKAFRDTIDVNLFGVRNAVQAVAPAMIERGNGGSLVLINSTQGLTARSGDGGGAMDGYVASKHAVVGLMRTYAHWLADHWIRVNSIHPTGVATPMVMSEAAARYLADNPKAEGMVKNLLPVDLIEPVDVSNAALWLASDEARYVTGVCLPVDAGWSLL